MALVPPSENEGSQYQEPPSPRQRPKKKKKKDKDEDAPYFIDNWDLNLNEAAEHFSKELDIFIACVKKKGGNIPPDFPRHDMFR